jgi:DNA-binding response OmpR family regulator
MSLLPVEDDEKIPRTIKKSLAGERFAVDVAADGPASMDAARGVVYAISNEGGA